MFFWLAWLFIDEWGTELLLILLQGVNSVFKMGHSSKVYPEFYLCFEETKLFQPVENKIQLKEF